MSKLTDYKGDVMVEMWVGWDVDVKANSLAGEATATDPTFKLGRCVLCSDRIRSIIITKRGLTPPIGKVPIAQPLAGIAREDYPICDLELAAYKLGPINTTDLQALIDEAKVAVQLSFSYREIFELILHEWQSSGTATLANRKDNDPLLESIIDRKHLGSQKSRVPFKYRELRARATTNAEIVDHEVTTSAGGAPAVKLVLLLDLPKDQFARALCAAEWSTLSEFKAKPPLSPSKLSQGLLCCMLNVQRLLAGTVDMTRGRKILSSILSSNSSITDAKDLVTGIRADIDKYLIAANHWGEARETIKSLDPVERYQARMSDFFGMLYEKYTLASPVNIARGVFKNKAFGINLFNPSQDEATLWLQLGVGHCGEHAKVGFRALREVMKAKPACPIQSIVLSANANIDHAFVLVNLTVDFVFRARVLNKQNQAFPFGAEIVVFDLKHALAQPGNAHALIHDAYLNFSRFEASAAKLLHSLQYKKNKALNATFVLFDEAHPGTPSELAVLHLSDDELRKDFPNI